LRKSFLLGKFNFANDNDRKIDFCLIFLSLDRKPFSIACST
jgi:hypothetical protein